MNVHCLDSLLKTLNIPLMLLSASELLIVSDHLQLSQITIIHHLRFSCMSEFILRIVSSKQYIQSISIYRREQVCHTDSRILYLFVLLHCPRLQRCLVVLVDFLSCGFY